ncbi:2-polyprenyl-6-methoxyphenol hydroxylase-like FAD-dependent oxidoreductase [Kibdelosporangium banguiense]|uniref:2-polyprenyl-6-methoxyphenol hydroxylase-like FAD-dependent oxidoreductase n=1 Tax=Kibdelosporangium banguiense TaxID=1365924 RepID=A0ABS4TTF2_9PSEU|nr:FAD-dependent monooxygenase [Kibdelosporangium banguiense]MBP2327233.1 2-polyprenyl-6-methoxyphenol hydroxylase-like FAD-dependent oxidoreductase [Kibdelosporangium banguiense]
MENHGSVDVDVDVVIVGGGIAGSALAAALAGSGYGVTVLERQTVYRDKVRGEVINCWGVAELMALGLEKQILDAGGTYVSRFVGFDETIDPAAAEAGALHLDEMLPDIPGVLDVGHPEACEALATAAAEAGATVIRGIGDVIVSAGAHPSVRYEHNDVEYEISCRLIVGADGRMSTVRRQLGIPIVQTPPNSLGGGLLVDELYDWPVDVTSIGTEGDLLYFVFPRIGGKARLYLLHDTAQKGRFTGPDRQQKFLEAFQFGCIPGSEMFGAARPSGTCAFYPMNDAWTDRPYTEGVVLVGDAAGWTDPVVGQGLSIALRDARTVWDTLRFSPKWTEDVFRQYSAERDVRMSRLRVSGQVRTTINMTFTPAGAQRRIAYREAWPADPVLAGSRVATFKGPFQVPPESFEPHVIERIFALQ